MLLDRAEGREVPYISTFRLFLAETSRCWAVLPFRNFGGRGHRAKPNMATSTGIKGQAPLQTNLVPDFDPSHRPPVARRVLLWVLVAGSGLRFLGTNFASTEAALVIRIGPTF